MTTARRSDAARMVEEFHRKYGAPIGERPEMISAEQALLRSSLVVEEAAELVTALSRRDLVAAADALADLLYVVHGTAIALGVDVDAVMAEVHSSNMSKQGKREDGKITKGRDYRAPDVALVLARQAVLG